MLCYYSKFHIVTDDVIVAISNSGMVKVWTLTGNESKVSTTVHFVLKSKFTLSARGPTLDIRIWRLRLIPALRELKYL